MNTSKNFICKLPDGPGVLEALTALRVVFNKRNEPIKWYRTKSGYTVYFRGNYIRKPKQVVVRPENLIEVPVVDLNTPAFDYIESTFTPEQVAA